MMREKGKGTKKHEERKGKNEKRGGMRKEQVKGEMNRQDMDMDMDMYR